jgi:hypothetical protein
MDQIRLRARGSIVDRAPAERAALWAGPAWRGRNGRGIRAAAGGRPSNTRSKCRGIF